MYPISWPSIIIIIIIIQHLKNQHLKNSNIYIYTHTHIHTYIYVRSEFLTFYNTFNSSPFRVQNQKRKKKKKEKNWPFITHWIDRSLNRQIKIIDVFFQNAQTYYLTTIFLFLKYQHISHIYLNTIKLAKNVHI